MSTSTPRQGRLPVEWGFWNGAEGTARRMRRRRGETLRRLESLEDRRLLAASISGVLGGALSYVGDAVVVDGVNVSYDAGTSTYTFTSNNDIAIGAVPLGMTMSHPGGNLKIVEATGVSSMDLLMNLFGNGATVEETTVPTTFTVGAGVTSSGLALGAAGDLSGITSSVTVAGVGASGVGVTVNGSAGTAGGAWTLSHDGIATATLAGFGGAGASLSYDPAAVANLALTNATNQTNSLTVDLAAGDPLPTSLFYNGGWSTTGTSNLVLIGDSTTFATETMTPVSSSAGSIAFAGPSHAINYSGISPHSIYDTVPAVNYTFNYLGGPADGVLLSDGANSALTGNDQTLMISSQGATPQFTDTHVANKTNVTVNQIALAANYSIDVNYALATPVAGLSLATIVQGIGNDTANLARLAPGAAWALNQGAGGDLATVSIPGTAGTLSTTLDGEEGFDVLTLDSGGLALSLDNFVVNPGGSVTISGTPLPGGPITYSNYEYVNVNDLAPLTPTVYGVPIHGVEGQRLDHVLVGAFTSLPEGLASDFVTTVDWGDGKTSTGTVVQDASNPSIFYVYGSHTYYNPGQGFATSITVQSLENSFQRHIGTAPTNFNRPAGTPVTQASQGFIDDAPIDVTVEAINGFENIAVASGADMIVATFVDQGGVDPTVADPAASYAATVYWGDGTAGVGAVSILRIGTTTQFVVRATPHVYAVPGSYPVTVVVAQPGEPTLGIGSQFANIADAPLNQTPSQPAIADATEGVRIIDAVIGSFVDANPLATTNQYEVTVDWGDGTGTQLARVIQPGGVGTPFLVIGSHTYATSLPIGTPPIANGGPLAPLTRDGDHILKISVRDTYGSAVNLFNTIQVLDAGLSIVGALDWASDTGASHADAITKDSTPSFSGWTSQGNARVHVFATVLGGTTVQLGSTTSDSTGAWHLDTTRSILDGEYLIQAQAIDFAGQTISPLVDLVPHLVIDTVGPRVSDVLFDNIRGRVILGYQDTGGVANAGSGLNLATVVDANNYRFVKQHQPLRRFLANSITVEPGTTTGEQVATVTFNGGQGIRGGRYAFRALSVDPSNRTGVQDIAGNALDGEYYGYLPSGNNVNGGDFAAYLDAIHHTIYPAQSQVGSATPVTPPGRPANGWRIRNDGSLIPQGTAAVRLAGRQPLTAARAARLGR